LLVFSGHQYVTTATIPVVGRIPKESFVGVIHRDLVLEILLSRPVVRENQATPSTVYLNVVRVKESPSDDEVVLHVEDQ
jgi:hypothetical protein